MKNLIPIIFLLFFVTLNAQDDKKPLLIDEIGRTGCEDLLARTDNLGLTLNKNKSASAFVISYSDRMDTAKSDWQLHFIHRALIARYGNQLTVTFLKKIDIGKARTEFWLVEPGTTFSVPDTEVLLQIPFKITKRTLFDEDDPGPCSGHVPLGFIEMLKSDVSLTGYVVNINDSKAERAGSIKYFLDFFRENNLADRRIRIYFKKKKMPDGYSFGYTEYWLMPKSS